MLVVEWTGVGCLVFGCASVLAVEWTAVLVCFWACVLVCLLSIGLLGDLVCCCVVWCLQWTAQILVNTNSSLLMMKRIE